MPSHTPPRAQGRRRPRPPACAVGEAARERRGDDTGDPADREDEAGRDDARHPAGGVIRCIELQGYEQLQRRQLDRPDREPGQREEGEPARADLAGLPRAHERASAMSVRYQSNEAFGVRCAVSKSTCTSPKRCDHPVRPLEVVQQRPDRVLADVDPRPHGGADGVDVAREVRDAIGVGDGPVDVLGLGERGAVLTDHQWRKAISVAFAEVQEKLRERRRHDRPLRAEPGDGRARRGDDLEGNGAVRRLRPPPSSGCRS